MHGIQALHCDAGRVWEAFPLARHSSQLARRDRDRTGFGGGRARSETPTREGLSRSSMASFADDWFGQAFAVAVAAVRERKNAAPVGRLAALRERIVRGAEATMGPCT